MGALPVERHILLMKYIGIIGIWCCWECTLHWLLRCVSCGKTLPLRTAPRTTTGVDILERHFCFVGAADGGGERANKTNTCLFRGEFPTIFRFDPEIPSLTDRYIHMFVEYVATSTNELRCTLRAAMFKIRYDNSVHPEGHFLGTMLVQVYETIVGES